MPMPDDARDTTTDPDEEYPWDCDWSLPFEDELGDREE